MLFTEKFHQRFALILGVLGLSLTTSVYAASCDPTMQVCNLKALIEQNPMDFNGLRPMLALAPNLQQLHLRVEAPGMGPPYTGTVAVNQMAQLIEQIRSVPGLNPDLQLGFHPDNSTSSYSGWGCQVGDWPCVFSNSIAFMNAVNQAVSKKGEGFSIFSLEQSYVEPAEITPGPPVIDKVALQKKCLQGSVVDGVCQVAAQPTVQFGYVSPSCGTANLYGPSDFDYGYPQMYNLSHNWKPNSGLPALPPGIFPDGGMQNESYSLVDAYNGQTIFPYLMIPAALSANKGGGDIATIYQAQYVDPVTAAQVLAALIVTRFGLGGDAGYPCGAGIGTSTRYFTLSGEPEFFGSTGWSPTQLATFFNNLVINLKNFGVTQADQIPFAIWGFDTMPLK
jgi:hypothetical protein